MDVTTELSRTTCWCGTPFMLPSRLLDSARNAGHTIYCPHGHTIVWKETEADRMRRERDRLAQQIAQRDDAIAERDRVIASKAREIKRIQKRAAAGTCPCCQRTFSNMAQHMKRQHPDYVQDTGANVVPIQIAR